MAINAATSASASAATQTNGIGLQDFLKILTSQLSNQDPLKPLDNQEFIAQVAQFSALEQSRELNQKIDQLLAVQSATQSVGLLGKSVEINASNGTVSGQVTALDLSSGSPQLTIQTGNGSSLAGVSVSQIITIR
jgi:flagellar basal-body rod modification protein FlgD